MIICNISIVVNLIYNGILKAPKKQPFFFQFILIRGKMFLFILIVTIKGLQLEFVGRSGDGL